MPDEFDFSEPPPIIQGQREGLKRRKSPKRGSQS